MTDLKMLLPCDAVIQLRIQDTPKHLGCPAACVPLLAVTAVAFLRVF